MFSITYHNHETGTKETKSFENKKLAKSYLKGQVYSGVVVKRGYCYFLSENLSVEVSTNF